MATSLPGEVGVADDPATSRYEVRVDGRLAGFAEYQRRPGRVVFIHTQVSPEFAGMGLANRLARFALDDARARGERVVPRCPFIAAWIERNSGYADLLAGRRAPEAAGVAPPDAAPPDAAPPDAAPA